MGYEVGGAFGAKMADPTRDVYCFIGDGTFLLSSQEIMTAVQEGLKLTVLLVDNYGYGSIAALSETRGSQGFACRFNYRGDDGQFSERPDQHRPARQRCQLRRQRAFRLDRR